MIEATIRAQVELQYALDRMSTPLHASRLSGATAAEDARCMAIIRAEIDRLTRERDEARAERDALAMTIAAERKGWIDEKAMRSTGSWGPRSEQEKNSGSR